jgi:NAD(P)-dependent dehydrogenase (short-subunit alcohol dehydrogenase family)
MQLDIADSEEIIHTKAKEAIAVWGRVDVLVNNAGVGAPGIAEEAGYAHKQSASLCPYKSAHS